MNIRLHIDRVVLDGAQLQPGDEPRFRAALGAELGRLVAAAAASGDLPDLATPRPVGPAAPPLRGRDVSFAPGGDARALARDVARSLFHSLGGRT